MTPAISVAPLDSPVAPDGARASLSRLDCYGVLAVTGDDARTFLHAQLTSDLSHLAADRAKLAGWCSAKGRLLANFLVVPHGAGYFLVVSRDLAAPVAKRLAMFVLRSKVKVEDVSEARVAVGFWGADIAARLAASGWMPPAEDLALASNAAGQPLVRLGPEQFLALVPAPAWGDIGRQPGIAAARDEEWALLEIRAGRALITLATQDKFVPQMVNLETVGGVDFRKGCYPGQEVVARSQYRGQLKRRMVRARIPLNVDLRAGQDLYGDASPGEPSGMVVNAAPAADGREFLAVVPLAALARQESIRVAPDAEPAALLDLPYST